MSMEQGDSVKTVNVVMSQQDESILTGKKSSRRQRKTRRNDSSNNLPESPIIPVNSVGGANLQVLKNDTPIVQPTQPTQPTQPMQPTQPTQPTQPMQPMQPTQPTQPIQPTTAPTPIVSSTTVVGGNVSILPKIMSNKKRTPISATNTLNKTIKKPKLIVPISATPGNHETPSSYGDAPQPSSIKKTRKFKQRTLNIRVTPTKSARKFKRTIKNRVHSMPIQNVKHMLVQKGILKPKNTFPPESIMRSMLKDYLLLHQAQ